jgi:hypothetical protein
MEKSGKLFRLIEISINILASKVVPINPTSETKKPEKAFTRLKNYWAYLLVYYHEVYMASITFSYIFENQNKVMIHYEHYGNNTNSGFQM